MVVLSRLLSPREFGIAAGTLLIFGLSDMLIDLGVGPALVQRDALTDDHITTAFYASFAFGLLLCVLFSVEAPAIVEFLRIPELRNVIPIASLVYLVAGVSTVSRAIAERALLFRKLSRVRVFTDGVLYGLVAVAAATAGASYWSLVYASLASALVSTVWYFCLARHPLQLRFRWALLRDLLKFGGGMSLARVVNYFGREGDTLVVARTFDTAGLGLYSRAFRLMVVPATVIGAAMDRVLFPVLSRAKDDGTRVGEALDRGIAGLSLLCLPTGIVFSVLAPEIVRVVLGPGWSGAVPPFQILALGLYFRLAYKLGGAVSMSHGAVYKNAACQFLYAAMVVGGSIVGRRWGLVGVASAVVVALIAEFVILWFLAARILQFPLGRFLRVHVIAVPVCLVALAGSVTSASLLRSLGAPDLVTLAATGLATAATVVGACVVLPGIFLGDHGQWWVTKARRMALARQEAS